MSTEDQNTTTNSTDTATQGAGQEAVGTTIAGSSLNSGSSETVLNKIEDAVKEEVEGALHVSISKGTGDSYLVQPRTGAAATVAKSELASWIDSQLA